MTPSSKVNNLCVPDTVDLQLIQLLLPVLGPKSEAYNAASEPLIVMLYTHVGSTTSNLTRSATVPSAASTTVYRSPFRLAAVRTNLVADASSSAEPLVRHVNADGEPVATAGEEGDGGGPATQDAPANMGTCDPKYWSCPGAAGYKVRGQTYLKVQCKVNIRVLLNAQHMCSAVGQMGL